MTVPMSLIARDRVPRHHLDVRDLARDLLGRLRGLHRQMLHLGGDHREAATGVARTRRLDRGVERQQIGLLGDVGDQAQQRGRCGS